MSDCHVPVQYVGATAHIIPSRHFPIPCALNGVTRLRNGQCAHSAEHEMHSCQQLQLGLADLPCNNFIAHRMDPRTRMNQIVSIICCDVTCRLTRFARSAHICDPDHSGPTPSLPGMPKSRTPTRSYFFSSVYCIMSDLLRVHSVDLQICAN